MTRPRSSDRRRIRATTMTVALVAPRWTIPIVVQLADGPKRQHELLADIGDCLLQHRDITTVHLGKEVLSRAIATLVHQGIIQPIEPDHRRTRYALTPFGRDIHAWIEASAELGLTHWQHMTSLLSRPPSGSI